MNRRPLSLLLVLVLMILSELGADGNADSIFKINFVPKTEYQFRKISPDTPIVLSALYDTLNARKIRNLPKNLSRLTYDSSSLKKNLDSVLFYSMPYYLNKYNLDSLDSAKLARHTVETLQTSPYFKNILRRWDNKKVMEYLVFRTEYELVRTNFDSFSLNNFKKSKEYQQLLDRLQKDYIPADRLDSLLSKVQKIDYAPLHFYYKPNSIQEQIAIDKTDIAALDFFPIVNFYDRNKLWLDSAEKKYGVNKEIIVGILKKETNFGYAPMNYRLFEVLLGQLTKFINNQAALPEEISSQEKRIGRLVRSAGNSLYHAVKYTLRNKLHPDSVRSNLVGAMGYPQFMPFNFGLAVDADGDGKADLNSFPDVIFSIANFFRDKGWREVYNYTAEEKPKIIKFILTYNSNPSYADAVYEIAEELHKIKNGKKALKKPKKTKKSKSRKKKSAKSKHKK